MNEQDRRVVGGVPITPRRLMTAERFWAPGRSRCLPWATENSWRGQANRALHLIAVCRLRYCPRTRDYAARRTTEGKTKKGIMRCLKRYIARELYRSLSADLADLASDRPRAPTVAISITCGAGYIGRNRHTGLA